MKLKKVVLTDSQVNMLEEFGVSLTPWDQKVNETYFLELNSWDVHDMNKCLTEYLSNKGEVFNKSVELFRRCDYEYFIKAYICTKYDGSVYDLLEFDEGYTYEKFVGFTAVRGSTRDELKKFLNRFSYNNRTNKEESHVEEVDKYLLRVYNCW